MKKKALLFINGQPPDILPDHHNFSLVACTDGAFLYLKDKDFPVEYLDFISGDFDSYIDAKKYMDNDKFIHTPDQDNTDFHKALDILYRKGCSDVVVYGGSGREQDHFVGNIHTALIFKDKVKITFFDNYSSYFFIPKSFTLNNVRGKMISILPFPSAGGITTKGLNWSLKNEKLSLGERIGSRNFATEDCVEIHYKSGNILLFVEK